MSRIATKYKIPKENNKMSNFSFYTFLLEKEYEKRKCVKLKVPLFVPTIKNPK